MADDVRTSHNVLSLSLSSYLPRPQGPDPGQARGYEDQRGTDEKRGTHHPAEGELKGAQGLEVGGAEQTTVVQPAEGRWAGERPGHQGPHGACLGLRAGP